jgi:ACS family hexuronate transporter-like MFS transporter
MAKHVTKSAWPGITKRRETWAIVIGRSLADPIWRFYVFWLSQYLSDTRGFSFKQIVEFAWIPFVAADPNNFAGGLSSGELIRRGIPVSSTRTIICVVSYIPMSARTPPVLTGNTLSSLTFICVALFGYIGWYTTGLTFPSGLFLSRVVASVTGLSGFAAELAGKIFTLLVGSVVDRFPYFPAFMVAATAPLLTTVSAIMFIRRTRQEGVPENA